MTIEDVVDSADPVKPLFKAYWRGLKNYCVISAVVGATFVVLGVPHVQWNYTHTGLRDVHGFVMADHKLDAWYFSLTGWRHVQAGDYQPGGLPVVLFIPLRDCLDDFTYFHRLER